VQPAVAGAQVALDATVVQDVPVTAGVEAGRRFEVGYVSTHLETV
jgi:hypothetical protein